MPAGPTRVSRESRGRGNGGRCHVRHFQVNSSCSVTRRCVCADGACGTQAASGEPSHHRSHSRARPENTTALGDWTVAKGRTLMRSGCLLSPLFLLPGSCGRFTDNPLHHSAAHPDRSSEIQTPDGHLPGSRTPVRGQAVQGQKEDVDAPLDLVVGGEFQRGGIRSISGRRSGREPERIGGGSAHQELWQE